MVLLRLEVNTKLLNNNGNYSSTVLVPKHSGDCKCHIYGDQQESCSQYTVADRGLRGDFGSLYFIECAVPFYRQSDRLCRGDHGVVPFRGHADEFEYGLRAAEEPVVKDCGGDHGRVAAAGAGGGVEESRSEDAAGGDEYRGYRVGSPSGDDPLP